jgi:H+-transporting ATPase
LPRRWQLVLLLLAFVTPMALLIWVGIVVELAVGIQKVAQGLEGAEGPTEHLVDFGVLMLLQVMNAVVGWHEEAKAGDAVDALKKSLAPKANVKRDGRWQVIPGRDLVPGDLVVLALGGAVPADCRLLHGKEIGVDQAALTGESLPVKMREGDVAKMGSTVSTGEIEAIVESTGANTFFGKTASLLNSVNDVSNLDKILMQILMSICSFGVPCIIAICAVLGERQNGIETVITQAVVLLVAVVPIANQVVCTSTLALGGRTLAEHKAIVTRLSSIEELAGMAMLCSDKTGTLTLNKMVMQEIVTTDGQAHQWPHGCALSEAATAVLRYSALATKWRETPKDALDRLVLGAAQPMLNELDSFVQLDYSPFDPSIKRTTATLRDPSGREFDVTKGAPPVVLKMAYNFHEIREPIERAIDDYAERGVRCIAVAVTDAQKRWNFAGLITFLDPPRPDTKATIQNANKLGVGVKMITGDQLAIARETCRTLGMGTSVFGANALPETADASDVDSVRAMDNIEVADGFAGMFPEHKFLIIDILRRRGWTVGMTGDGVNDAPALKKADVGIAVQGATDAACAAADIVLMEEGLSTIIVAIRLSRKIFQRMKNYLTYRVASSLMLALFFVISVAAFNPLEHLNCQTLFNVPGGYYNSTAEQMLCATTTVLGSSTCLPAGTETTCQIDQLSQNNDVVVDMNSVAIPNYFLLNILQLVFMIMFNDICMITVAWDNVKDSRIPMTWNMRRLYALASVLCVTVALLQLLYLIIGYSAMLPASQQPAPMNLIWALGYHTPLQFSEMETMMYISLSWAGFLTLLACRNEGFFWESLPGKELFVAFCVSIGATTLLGSLLKADSISFWATPFPVVLITLIYNLLAFFILDFVKAVANWSFDRIEGKVDPIVGKSMKMSLWAQNRASLATRETGNDRNTGNGAGAARSTREAEDARPRTGHRANPEEIERLHGAVAKLAGLLGAVQPESQVAVAEILASLRS